jgi:hypothetical protein
MIEAGALDGVVAEDIDWSDEQACDVCARTKVKQSRVPRKVNRLGSQPFEMGSVDIFGPVSVPSIGDNRYGLIYCDHYSSFGFVEFLSTKELDGIVNAIRKWQVTSTQAGYQMKRLLFDSDTIFENEELQNRLLELGISTVYASPGSHQSNGLVERMIQTVVGMARAMLIGAGLPTKYWSYALDYAVLIYNVILKSRFNYDVIRHDRSPYMIVYNDKPVFHLPVFGCLLIARDPDALNLMKFEARGRRGVFLGIDRQHDNCYRYLSLESGEIIMARDVTILEDYYGYDMRPTDYYRQHDQVIEFEKAVKKR